MKGINKPKSLGLLEDLFPVVRAPTRRRVSRIEDVRRSLRSGQLEGPSTGGAPGPMPWFR